jgi:hypothetical protein
MHSAWKPSRGMLPTLPTLVELAAGWRVGWVYAHQASPSQPTPVVRLTFSSRVNWRTNACAFSYASAQPAAEASIHLQDVSTDSRAVDGLIRTDWDRMGGRRRKHHSARQE